MAVDRPADPVMSPADTRERYEIDVLIGPCSQAECEALMEAILDLPETTAVGGVVACGPWTGEQTRRALLAVGERDKAEIAELDGALRATVKALNAELVARERDRQQIARLTEVERAAQELVAAERQDAAAIERLIGSPDPDGTLAKVQALTRANADAAFSALVAVLAGEEDAGAECSACDGLGFQAGAHTERVEPCPVCDGTARAAGEGDTRP